jgi:uncharacterized protein (TIGR02246 family)
MVQQDLPDQTTQVRALIERWAQAVRDGEMEGIIAHHSNDVLMFDVPPPVQVKGLVAYRAGWDLFFEYSPGGPGSFDLSDIEVTASESVAFAHALITIGGASPARLSMGFRKEDGEWLIAHEHHSFPSAAPE